MRKIIKRLLVSVIAVTLMLSSFTVYADYNGGEQGETSSGTKTVKDGSQSTS